jgi:hypothetical protein
MYRWVDEHGTMHAGHRPSSEKESKRIETEPASSPAREDGARRSKAQRLLDALESERHREKQNAAQAEADEARRERSRQSTRRGAAL